MSYIIMKYDDLSIETLMCFSRVADFSIKNKIPISMGIIGKSLVEENIEYTELCESWMNSGIELWNHGYYHSDEEFSTAKFEEQCVSLSKTQELILKRFGKPAVTFGSPHNNSTETTIRALSKSAPEIRNYLFAVDGSYNTSARQLLVRCNMETVTGNIDFDFFYKNYKLLSDMPYMIIQGHPSFWQMKDFKLNEKIIQWLIKEGNEFVTPSTLQDISKNITTDTKFSVLSDELIRFLKKSDKKIVLYGAGEIGREVYRFLTSTCKMKIECFVVSDNQEICEKSICGEPVLNYSEFVKERGNECVVLLTLMPQFHESICKQLNKDEIEYFNVADKSKYLRMINDIRLRIF